MFGGVCYKNNHEATGVQNFLKIEGAPMEVYDYHQPSNSVWNPFAASKLVSLMLKSGRVENSVPAAVAAGLRIISLYKIAEEWTVSIEAGHFLNDSEIVKETYKLLNNAGFKEENSFYCVSCLVAALLGSKRDMLAVFDPASDFLPVTLAKALIAGYAGLPDQSLIHWLLEHGPENQTAALAGALYEVAQGNESSLRSLISLIFPFWKNLVEEWTGEDFNISSLGFLFESASRLPDHPALMAWRAMMIHRFGFSGDEDAAYRLIAQAAFLGSPEAWRLIEEWSFCSGDQERVMKALIDVGREKFCKLQE
jgi:hypothetical protein